MCHRLQHSCAVLIQRTSIWPTAHSFVKLSSGIRKYSNVAFSTVMLPFQRIILITANHSQISRQQGSNRIPTPTPPKRAPKNDPPGRLDGKLKNHKLVHIPPTKIDRTPTRKCRVCGRKNIKKETRFLCSIWCSSASRGLLHTISHAETLLKAWPKFQAFISYSFCVIIFLLKS